MRKVIITRAGMTALPALTLPSHPRICPACSHDLTTFAGIGKHNEAVAAGRESRYVYPRREVGT